MTGRWVKNDQFLWCELFLAVIATETFEYHVYERALSSSLFSWKRRQRREFLACNDLHAF